MLARGMTTATTLFTIVLGITYNLERSIHSVWKCHAVSIKSATKRASKKVLGNDVDLRAALIEQIKANDERDCPARERFTLSLDFTFLLEWKKSVLGRG